MLLARLNPYIYAMTRGLSFYWRSVLFVGVNAVYKFIYLAPNELINHVSILKIYRILCVFSINSRMCHSVFKCTTCRSRDNTHLDWVLCWSVILEMVVRTWHPSKTSSNLFCWDYHNSNFDFLEAGCTVVQNNACEIRNFFQLMGRSKGNSIWNLIKH